MNQCDRAYYLSRIATERSAAQSAAHPLAALSHQRLADEYASLIDASDSLAGCFSDSLALSR